MSHAHARARSSKPFQQIHPTYFFFCSARSQIGARPRRFFGPIITQQTQETNSHSLSGFRTRGLSSQAPLLYGEGQQQPVDIPAVTKYELRWVGHVVRIGKARSSWECRRRVCEETRSGYVEVM